jgi:hypothetical protein
MRRFASSPIENLFKAAFEIVYRPETLRHLDAIEAKYLGLIRTAIEEQLLH